MYQDFIFSSSMVQPSTWRHPSLHHRLSLPCSICQKMSQSPTTLHLIPLFVADNLLALDRNPSLFHLSRWIIWICKLPCKPSETFIGLSCQVSVLDIFDDPKPDKHKECENLIWGFWFFFKSIFLNMYSFGFLCNLSFSNPSSFLINVKTVGIWRWKFLDLVVSQIHLHS